MMKMTTNDEIVEAVILKRTAYKENDMILHIYSKDYGKMSVLARGVRKVTSKNASATQEMMVSELELRLKKGMSTLIRATPIHYLRHIKEHLESEIVGNYILEYFYRYVADNEPSLEEYQILMGALNALENGYNPLLIYLMFDIYILKHNGVMLDVDGCVVCGSHLVVSFSLNDGGFLCQDHVGQEKIYSPEVLKGIRHLHKLSFDQIDKLVLDERVIREIIPIMDYYIEEYAGISLRTKTFIKQIV